MMRSFIKFTIGFFLVCSVFLFFFFQRIETPSHSFSTALYSADGKLLRVSLTGDEKFRLPATVSEISKVYLDTLLNYEDKYFFYHFGINPFAFVRAFYKTYLTKERRVGASTITMQLARLTSRKTSRSLIGKLTQILRSFFLELQMSKVQILESYLELAPFGKNIEGIEAASLYYFHKKGNELENYEAYFLSRLPQNPNQDVRKLWALTCQKFNLSQCSSYLKRSFPFRAPHFTNKILRDLVYPNQKFANASNIPKRSRLSTSLDLELQDQFRGIVKSYVNRQSVYSIENASVMLVNADSMLVRALVGSADFFSNVIHGQVDGTNALRSPGSTLKPFVYGLAIEKGLIHPLSLLKDTPKGFASWYPQNYDDAYVGPLSATQALVRSRNVPAVELSQNLPHESGLFELLEDAEVPILFSKNHYGLAPVLGAMEIRMVDLVRLYGSILNGGRIRPLRYIDANEKASNPQQNKQILSEEAAYSVHWILRHNPSPSQNYYRFSKHRSLAWKTGTSWGMKDAWALGTVGRFVLAVWIGNFDGKSNPELKGRNMAGPLFFELAELLKSSYPYLANLELIRPRGLKSQSVCAVSGLTASSSCPHQKKTIVSDRFMNFEECRVHRQLAIAKNGYLSCPLAGVMPQRFQTFTLWDSDIKSLYLKAGIRFMDPPDKHPSCKQINHMNRSNPEILDLNTKTDYVIPKKDASIEISLRAYCTGSCKKLYWFKNELLVGEVNPAETKQVRFTHGDHLVRVVDDSGLSDTVKLRVRKL